MEGKRNGRFAAWRLAWAFLAVVALGFAFAGKGEVSASGEIPQWRGEAPGTAYLGPDVLWRPREYVIFHMYDEEGGGFDLSLTVRDMNTYMQGPRKLAIWVVGPGGETLLRELIEDDGVVSGNDRYRDGVYEVFQDFRYREWHRAHSPGGYPPGKERSPFLENPEKLAARERTFSVPAGSEAGLYRVFVFGSWDHWISLTPDRPLPTGIHPGPGPLYVHGDRLREAWFYVPEAVEDIGFSVSEEIAPYNWKVRLEEPEGDLIAETEPRTFFSYLVHTPESGDRLYRIRVEGETTGANLHAQGFPFVLTPDAETAEKIRGGAQVDDKGRLTFYRHQRVVNEWADGLVVEDLEPVAGRPDPAGVEDEDLRGWVAAAAAVFDEQNLDPGSPDYGKFPERGDADTLARLVGREHPENAWHGDPGLIRRVMLARVDNIGRVNPFGYYWYRGADQDFPSAINPRAGSIGSLPFRSNWPSFYYHVQYSRAGLFMKEVMDDTLPAEVIEAYKQNLEILVGARWMMHCVELSNQWIYNLAHFVEIARFTGNEDIFETVRRHLRQLLTPGYFGRLNPDPTWYRSSTGYSFPADAGLTGADYLADGLGFDAAYADDQDQHLRQVYQHLPDPLILEYLQRFYPLKSHLTLPRDGRHVSQYFRGVASPTDINFRTRNYVHRSAFFSHLPETIPQVPYADLWAQEGAEDPERPWPALEEEPFTRVFDDKFIFINTPQYYSITYSGPSKPQWWYFTQARVEDGSASLEGYGDMGRGGFQRSAAKPGGISAVFVPGCGPTLIGSNTDVMYTNALWGRTKEPNFELFSAGVDPRIISSAFVDPQTTFAEESRMYEKTGEFLYAPLRFRRNIQYQDDRIVVDLEITATGDVELESFYEAIPYYADQRTIRTFDGSLEETARFDPMAGAGESVEEALAFRAFAIEGERGGGSTVIFDREYSFVQSEAIRYRDLAAHKRSFNLPLPLQWRAGDREHIRYVIYSSQERPNTAVLTGIVEDSFAD